MARNNRFGYLQKSFARSISAAKLNNIQLLSTKNFSRITNKDNDTRRTKSAR